LRDKGEEKTTENKREELSFQDERRRENKLKVCCAHVAFILGFTGGIPNGQLNIIIFKNFVDDFICKVKLKFSIHTKYFKNSSSFFNSLGNREHSQRSEMH
jgi:hypothetical protein